MGKKYDVFISYSSHDQKIAEGICGFLESNGYRCFVAYRDIVPGVVWARAITEAMDDSSMMVVVFSDEFNGSEQTDREIQMASESKMPIVPYRITSTNLTGAKKYWLLNVHWIDAFPNPEGYFGKLLESVKRLVPRETDLEVQSQNTNNAVRMNAVGPATISPSVWEQATERWTKDGKWKLLVGEDSIRLHRPDNSEIHVELGFGEDHYYIQAKYHLFVDFSQELKWKYKGRRTYETWWCHIQDSDFFNLKEGEFWEEFKNNERMQKVLVDWFDKLIAFILKFDVPANRYHELMNIIDQKYYEEQGWGVWIYDSFCVVCDTNYEEGKPFIDTFTDNDGKIVVRLGNRDNDVEMQKRILDCFGLSDFRIRTEDGRTDYAVFEKGTPDKVIMAKVAELMAKLSKQ